MAKKYVSKIVKFMLSNPQDLKRLQALGGISFNKYVKGKLDEDILKDSEAGVVGVFQEQILRLQKEIAKLKSRHAASLTTRPTGNKESRRTLSVNEWFED
jgi:hypothetical protein